MRLTTKRNGKNAIPLLMAVCGINLPYWRIDRADDLHSYLLGDAADRLAAYEDAEEQELLVRLPCKVGDMVYYGRGRDILGDTVERIIIDGIDNQVIVGAHKAFMFRDFGRNVFTSREEAEAALKGAEK